MSHPFGTHYLDEVRRQFRGYKRLAEGAIAQLKDEELFITLDPEANSIAVIMKHMAGNMRSRFTDFLTTDGEKPDRHRDQEFEINADATRAEVMRRWEARALRPACRLELIYLFHRAHACWRDGDFAPTRKWSIWIQRAF